MSNYSIEWKKSAVKEISDLPYEVASKIYNEISLLSTNPRPHGYRKLTASHDLYRIKVNNYRIVYSIIDERLIVQVIKIAHRRDVYRNL